MQKILLMVAILMTVASNAFALDTTIADLFAAADVSAVATGIGVILLAGVGCALLMAGYKWIKKTLGRF